MIEKCTEAIERCEKKQYGDIHHAQRVKTVMNVAFNLQYSTLVVYNNLKQAVKHV